MCKFPSIPSLLVALVLCCVPAVAQVNLNVGAGATLIHDDVYAAHAESSVTLGARASVGDAIGLAVVGFDKNGQLDYSTLVVLLVKHDSPTGDLSSLFPIPAELAGMNFMLMAGSLNVDGALFLDTAILSIRPGQDADSV
jgi:hypothetical protein